MERHSQLNVVPNPTPERQPAPDGWADAYRETLEHVWAGIHDGDDNRPTNAQAGEIVALAAFAAEIRAGLAAGLILPGRVTVNVPLVGATCDERPSRAHGPNPDHACAAHDDAHIGLPCPDRTGA